MYSDRLVIRNLQVPTLIGVFPFEREALQTLRLDITLHTDIARAGATDDLVHTLNYAAVAETVVAFGAQATFQLLEAFAEALSQLLFARFPVPRIDFVIYKDGCIPGAQGAELHITRERSHGED